MRFSSRDIPTDGRGHGDARTRQSGAARLDVRCCRRAPTAAVDAWEKPAQRQNKEMSAGSSVLIDISAQRNR